ncbi:hypothetical protein [Micromonospora sp. NPDC048839]|uniref:hypothetical protein n=1 Tax=Micromonospora sp. NPDC048839 TaxID=3155641 RepID=UPI0033F8CC0B
MAIAQRDPEDDAIAQQRIVSRSFLFVYVPLIFIVILSANLAWVVYRQNSNSPQASDAGMKFLSIDASASLLALAVGLLLTRLQWASANRPSMAFAIDDEGAQFSKDSTSWRIWLHNGGPGHAVIRDFRYTIRFVGQPASTLCRLSEINQALASRGLVDGRDYFIRWLERGAPSPPIGHYDQGLKVAWFSLEALAELAEFNIHITLVDGAGDVHAVDLFAIDKMPSVAVRRFMELRNSKTVTP